MADQSISFITDDGSKVTFYVVEQTMIAGVNYLLVADEQEEESEAYIMKEVMDRDDQVVYELVEDDHELSAITKVFAELLDDIDIEY